MPDEIYDLIVIGAGPGGYTAAIRASQLGMKVALVERREPPGGVCLNEGCIPSKALLDSSELFALARDDFARHGILADNLTLDLARMMARKDDVVKKLGDGIAFLLRKNRIQCFEGNGKPAGPRKDGLHVVAITSSDTPPIPRLINGRRILLATGSRPVELPGLPFDGATVVSSREALSFPAVPEHLVIVGGGYIGLELGLVWNRLGARVTLLEELPWILPHADRQVADVLLRTLTKQGLRFLFHARVTGFDIADGKAKMQVTASEATEELECDRILVAAGRTPETDGLGLSAAGIRMDGHGRVIVDENYQTSANGIYAIGDLIPGPLLAHRAMEEGTVFAERLAGLALIGGIRIPPGRGLYPAGGCLGGMDGRAGEGRRAPLLRGQIPLLRKRQGPMPGRHGRVRQDHRPRRNRKGPRGSCHRAARIGAHCRGGDGHDLRRERRGHRPDPARPPHPLGGDEGGCAGYHEECFAWII